MKRRYRGIIAVLLAMCIFTGCGKEREFDVDAAKESVNPFEENSEAENTEVAGAITHGIVWDSEDADELQYKGGEMEVPYKVNASGMAVSCGFLIYIDGIPQPYKVKDVTDTYESLHRFEFKEETDEEFSFLFTPVTGKKGDHLSICITSIIHPGFQPDMTETFSYGHSHKALEGIYTLKFLCDAEDRSDDIGGTSLGKKLNLTENAIVQDELKRYTEHGEELSLDRDVITELYIDDEDMQLSESYEIGKKNKVHLKYRIMGHPGLEYKTTFYIDHNPITIDGETAVTSFLKNGQVEIMEFDLDASQLENKTVYAISVPCNKEDYPDDPVGLYKTNSILFYKGKNPIKADIDLLEAKLNGFQEMKSVKYAGNNKVMLFADRMYILDLKSGEIEAQAESLEDYSYEFELYQVKDGYVTVAGNKDNHIICRFYNESLKQTKEVDLYKDYNLDPVFVNLAAVSGDGTEIAAVDLEGLYICKIADKEKKQILYLGDTNYEERKGITGINQIRFSGNQIVFLSQNFDLPVKENAQSYIAYGSINRNGTNLFVEKGKEYGRLQQTQDTVLLSEDIPEKGPGGEACLYCGKERWPVSFSEKEESGNVFGSDYGNYIITSLNLENKGWRIRGYQKDGSMVKEEMYACKNTGDYMDPYLFFMEESNILLLYFRPLGGNSQYKIAVLP